MIALFRVRLTGLDSPSYKLRPVPRFSGPWLGCSSKCPSDKYRSSGHLRKLFLVMSDHRERFDIESTTHEPSRSSTDSDSVDSKPRARQGSTSTSQRERSSSRPRSSEITRIYSGVYLDDHSVYHGDDDNEASADRDSSRGNNEKDLDVALEVRNGIVNERDLDLEANRQGPTAEIEKTRTARSEQAPDPKLVSKLRLSCFTFRYINCSTDYVGWAR